MKKLIFIVPFIILLLIIRVPAFSNPVEKDKQLSLFSISTKNIVLHTSPSSGVPASYYQLDANSQEVLTNIILAIDKYLGEYIEYVEMNYGIISNQVSIVVPPPNTPFYRFEVHIGSGSVTVSPGILGEDHLFIPATLIQNFYNDPAKYTAGVFSEITAATASNVFDVVKSEASGSREASLNLKGYLNVTEIGYSALNDLNHERYMLELNLLGEVTVLYASQESDNEKKQKLIDIYQSRGNELLQLLSIKHQPIIPDTTIWQKSYEIANEKGISKATAPGGRTYLMPRLPAFEDLIEFLYRKE